MKMPTLLLWELLGGAPASLPIPSLSAVNGEVAISGGATANTIEIEVTTPAWHAGVWRASLADLFSGWAVLRDAVTDAEAVPRIEGTATIGSVLTGRPGLVLYDADSYPSGFVPVYEWRRNGTPISGATGLSYTAVTADGGAALTFCMGLPPQDTGGEVTWVVSAPTMIAAPTAGVTVAFNGTSQFIPLTGVMPNRRVLAFGARMTFTKFGATQRVLGCTNATISNGIQLGSGNTVVIQGQPVSVNPVTNLSGGAVASGTPHCVVAFCTDLDNPTLRISRWLVDGAVTLWDGNRNQSSPMANPGVYLADVVGLGARRQSNGAGTDFAGVTFHGFVWIDDQPVLDTVLRDQLFEAVSLGTDPTGWRPRTLPANGQITVSGSPRVPLIFLSGAGFGQLEVVSHTNFTPAPSSGVWAVPNRGRGQAYLPLIGGPLS